MAKLTIYTPLKRVVICGEFCNWDIDKAREAVKTGKGKSIVVDDMPKGEYRVFSCKSFLGCEVYPCGRQMPNRYFDGSVNEVIVSKFIKEM